MSNGTVKSARNGNGAQAPDSPRDDSVSPAPPPDGGWGWMVVFASFMIHVISEYFLFLTFFHNYKIIFRNQCGHGISSNF